MIKVVWIPKDKEDTPPRTKARWFKVIRWLQQYIIWRYHAPWLKPEKIKAIKCD